MSFVKILLSVPDSAVTMQSYLDIDNAATPFDPAPLQKLIHRVTSGQQNAFAKISVGAVQASGTITFSSLANNDTVTVNGRVYTAKTSGASGLQEFNLGSSDTDAATNFTAKVNADTSTLIAGVVTALSAAAITTITAVQPGLSGNSITIAISAHGSVSGSGLLTSGSDGTQVNVNYGASS